MNFKSYFFLGPEGANLRNPTIVWIQSMALLSKKKSEILLFAQRFGGLRQ